MANNFNPGFDREKAAFIALANRGEGLAPINYLYAKEASFESILSPVITGGTAELYTIYASNINSTNITNTEDIITNKLKWSNPSNDYYVGFRGGSLTKNTLWTLPVEDGSTGQVLSTDGSGILSFIDNGEGKAPYNATYILQRPDNELPNAQGLSDLAPGGILKSSPLGVVSVAAGGKTPFLDDYVDPLSLQEEIEATITECKTFATVKATEAKIEAIAYFTGQMFPYVPSTIPFSGIGYQITYAIASAAAIATDAKNSADNANSRIDNLSVVGDVIGTNMGSDTIVTVFTPNPTFSGTEYMRIPTGSTAERPVFAEIGMTRYNIEI